MRVDGLLMLRLVNACTVVGFNMVFNVAENMALEWLHLTTLTFKVNNIFSFFKITIKNLEYLK